MHSVKKILVFGATSAIAHEAMKLFASDNCEFYLVARDPTKLTIVADDLRARGGVIVGTESYDFCEHNQLTASMTNATDALKSIDLVFVAHGQLPDQRTMEQDAAALSQSININYTSNAVICMAAISQLEQQGHGKLAVISSVAGDRGRKSNYAYGATKSGLSTMLEGLSGRTANSNINIINIKPGMIDTPMTSSMSKGALWASPAAIAPAIYKAIQSSKSVVYVPGYWRFIMLIIKLMPAKILYKLPI